jgi:hypothetical protein
MFARACLLAVGASWVLAASAAAEAPASPEEAAVTREATRQPGRPDLVQRRFHWGIPESPFPALEAERKLIGFHLRFEFGHSDAPRRGYRLR